MSAETADMTARPEARLWLRLAVCAAMIEERLRVRLRDEFAMTPARFDLMAHLDKVEGGLTMGELSRRLMVTNGNVTGLASRLADDGLVARLSSPADRRTFYLQLTPKGRRVFRTMAERHGHWLADLFADLERDEVAQLMMLMDKLKRSVHAAQPGA